MAKSLKDILVRAKVPPVRKNKGFYGPCKKSRFEILNTDGFESTAIERTEAATRGVL